MDRGSQLDEEDEDEAGAEGMSGRHERKAGRQGAGGNFDKI